MNVSIDWGLLIAGLGLFMLGMYFLELSLKSLLNRAVVAALRSATASLWLAVPLGTLLTALLQSSSLLGLLVLAFVGAGVMPMRNALGVILGANLGTTITGWIVTWLGFRLELDSFALPLMGVGALLKIWLEGRMRWESIGHLCLGLGLLLGVGVAGGERADGGAGCGCRWWAWWRRGARAAGGAHGSARWSRWSASWRFPSAG